MRAPRDPGIGRAVAVAAALAAAAVLVRPAAAQDPWTVATARVTYVAGGTVYLDAGRLDGIALSDTLRVASGVAINTRLVVRYLSSHRASCDTLDATGMPRIGDLVRYFRDVTGGIAAADSASGPPDTPADAAAGAAADTSASPRRDALRSAVRPVRGRVGVRLLSVNPAGASGYTQPSLDVRMDLDQAFGSPIDLAIDTRSRRTYHGAGGGESGEARVYRLSLAIHDPANRKRITVGRQRSSSVGVASLFDGALVEALGRRWDAGVFSGAQPDPVRMTPSFDILQHGAYVAAHSVPFQTRQWSAVAGAIASLDSGHVNRNFIYLQSSYVDPRVTMSLAQEVDVNSGWKIEAGEPALAPTSTFAIGRYRLRPNLTLDAGYDNRRRVRLYRDRITPVTEFDDAYRQGFWLGGAVEPMNHLRIGADSRWNTGGDGGDFQASTANLDLSGLPLLQSDLRSRVTRFSGDASEGWLLSGAIGVRPVGRTHLELHAGHRTSRESLTGVQSSVDWFGADADIGLGRRWYLLLSGEQDRDESGTGVIAYGSVSWQL